MDKCLNCGKDNFPNMPTEPCDDCQIKESLFERLLDLSYFTVWDGYLETPISWVEGISGNLWIGDITTELIGWFDDDDKEYHCGDGLLIENITEESDYIDIALEHWNTYDNAIKEWIVDNECFLWDIFEGWYDNASDKEIKEMEGC